VFKVDFDGNLTWERSSAAVKTVSLQVSTGKGILRCALSTSGTRGPTDHRGQKVRARGRPVVNIVFAANQQLFPRRRSRSQCDREHVEHDLAQERDALKDGRQHHHAHRQGRGRATPPIFPPPHHRDPGFPAPRTSPRCPAPALVRATQPTWNPWPPRRLRAATAWYRTSPGPRRTSLPAAEIKEHHSSTLR